MPRLYDVLDLLKAMCDAISRSFGDHCEVVIHDLSKPRSSIIYIANGHVTGRREGDSMQSPLMETLMRNGGTADGFVNYLFTTSEGRVLRSTSVIINEDDGTPVGALSINYDVTDLKMSADVISQVLNIPKPTFPKSFPNDYSEILELYIGEAVQRIGRPVAYMTKDEKVRVVEVLHARGAFQVRDAVNRIAGFLGVSRYTVYNYLAEARAARVKSRVPAGGTEEHLP